MCQSSANSFGSFGSPIPNRVNALNLLRVYATILVFIAHTNFSQPLSMAGSARIFGTHRLGPLGEFFPAFRLSG